MWSVVSFTRTRLWNWHASAPVSSDTMRNDYSLLPLLTCWHLANVNVKKIMFFLRFVFVSRAMNKARTMLVICSDRSCWGKMIRGASLQLFKKKKSSLSCHIQFTKITSVTACLLPCLILVFGLFFSSDLHASSALFARYWFRIKIFVLFLPLN